MATSTLEKFPEIEQCSGGRHFPGEPAALPLIAQILRLIGEAESFELPLKYKDIYVLVFNVLFQTLVKIPAQVFAITNHIKVVDACYYLAGSLSYVL